MRYLTFALAKGRLAKTAMEMFEKIGIKCEEMKDKNTRKLIFVNEDLKLKFFLAKASDVPTYVEYGAADIGIVGKDLKPLNQTDGLNELFIKSIKKKYGNLDDNKNTFKMDCRNFTSITSKQNWKEEIRKIFDTVKLSSCLDNNFSSNSNIESTKVTAVTSNNTKIVYSFDGSLHPTIDSDKANLKSPKTLSYNGYDYQRAA